MITEKPLPDDSVAHEADPHHYDPLIGQSWCVCAELHYPHDIVRRELPAEYRHLTCGVDGPHGTFCTLSLGDAVIGFEHDKRGRHAAYVGMPGSWHRMVWNEGWRTQAPIQE